MPAGLCWLKPQIKIYFETILSATEGVINKKKGPIVYILLKVDLNQTNSSVLNCI